jgi:ubiquinol oxidase
MKLTMYQVGPNGAGVEDRQLDGTLHLGDLGSVEVNTVVYLGDTCTSHSTGTITMPNTPYIDLAVHHRPENASDRVALAFTKAMRFCADTFFAKRYGHRAVVLETIAAVPGMVGATLKHLRALRDMSDDHGWIRTLLEEAENERMHLMTFIEVAQPTRFERFVIISAQWVFYLAYFLLYLASAKTAHRVIGYFEEEAVYSYTLYLQEIDDGRAANGPAPDIAKHYWKLPADATLRDVVLVVRADEAHHRDVNHGLASEMSGDAAAFAHVSPYPEHADTIRKVA